MKSYFHQPGNSVCFYETIPERLRKQAEIHPNRIAIVAYHDENERHHITRQDLYDRAETFGLALIKMGLNKGDQVAFCMSNCVNWLAYDVGIQMAGGVPVHLRCNSFDRAALAGSTVVILDSKKDWAHFLSVAKIGTGGKVTYKDCPSLKTAIATSSLNRPANALLAEEMTAEIASMSDHSSLKFPSIDHENIAFINQVTVKSGTVRKVVHNHFDAVNCPSFLCEGFTEDDIRYSGGPLSETSNYPFGYIQKGCKIICGDPAFLMSPKHFEHVVDIWRKECCTIISMIPGNLKLLKKYGFRCKMISTIGEGVTKENLNHSFIFADKVIVVYDCTEALRISHRVFTKDNINEYQEGMFGRPTEGVEVKIVDDKGNTTELGEPGILCVRSPWLTVSSGGHHSSTPTEKDWYQTNYVARMQPGGDIIIVSKNKTS